MMFMLKSLEVESPRKGPGQIRHRMHLQHESEVETCRPDFSWFDGCTTANINQTYLNQKLFNQENHNKIYSPQTYNSGPMWGLFRCFPDWGPMLGAFPMCVVPSEPVLEVFHFGVDPVVITGLSQFFNPRNETQGSSGVFLLETHTVRPLCRDWDCKSGTTDLQQKAWNGLKSDILTS